MKTKLFYLLMCLFAISSITNAQTISLIGSGVGGWGTDVNLATTDHVNYTAKGLIFAPSLDNGVLKCEVKFRQDAAWTNNWGSVDFPIGIGTNNGSNIVVIPGTYDVAFNINTGAYSFQVGTPNAVVKLFGTATNPSTGITMNTADGVTYTLGANTLLAGNAQFSVDGNTVGAIAFPSGTATGLPTDFIPVTAGGYLSITFNINTLEYTFVPGFPAISIVGESVGGWPGDPGNLGPIDTNQLTTTDGITYTIKNLLCTTAASGGGAKFRLNNAWGTSWGNDAFPTASSSNGNNILTVAGTYNVTFNIGTGAFTFSYPTISIVGESVGGWPGDPGNLGPIDTHQLTTTDGITYTISNLVCTAAASGGGAKFRLNNDWGTSWGNDAFPSATSSNGNNILTVAGTYNVTFTRSTGAFTFTNALAVKGFNASSFSAYPNPTQNSWTISSGSDAITSVQVFDILGKSVYVKTASSNDVSVNASNLSKGTYLAKVATANGSSTIKLVKN